MTLPVPNQHIILLLGAPRSGTTWLGKIFDSHPDVLYRHEPDTVLRHSEFPALVKPQDLERYKEAAYRYLHRLFAIRTLKSAGSLPIFPKNYESAVFRAARSLTIFALRVAEQLPLAARAARRVPIPEMVTAPALANLRIVLKSVSARGCARLFAEALPGCRIIFILRDPCGQVASMMRGFALGKFESQIALDELLATEQAARYGLTAERLHAMAPVEQFAWHWAMLNEKAMEDLAGLTNVCVFRYQDLAGDAEGKARDLFAFAGLDWHAQTEAFIRKSTHYTGREGYYQVFRNSSNAVNKWRSELARDDIRCITRVVSATPLWSFFPELQEFAAA